MGPSFEVPVLLTAVSGYKSSVGVSDVEHSLEVVKSLRCLRDPERIHNVLLQFRLDLNKHLLDLLRDRKVLPTVPSDELENAHGTNFMHKGLIQLARSRNAGFESGVAAGARAALSPCALSPSPHRLRTRLPDPCAALRVPFRPMSVASRPR